MFWLQYSKLIFPKSMAKIWIKFSFIMTRRAVTVRTKRPNFWTKCRRIWELLFRTNQTFQSKERTSVRWIFSASDGWNNIFKKVKHQLFLGFGRKQSHSGRKWPPKCAEGCLVPGNGGWGPSVRRTEDTLSTRETFINENLVTESVNHFEPSEKNMTVRQQNVWC